MPRSTAWCNALRFRLLATALIVSPLLVAISAWLHQFSRSYVSEIALASLGYGGLMFSSIMIRGNEESCSINQSAKTNQKQESDFTIILLKFRSYGLLVTSATLIIFANAIAVVIFSAAPQVSFSTRVFFLGIISCPNVWVALFVNVLVFVGWLIELRPISAAAK